MLRRVTHLQRILTLPHLIIFFPYNRKEQW